MRRPPAILGHGVLGQHCRQREAAKNDGPEDQFLAGIEATRGRMPVREKSTELLEPFEIVAVGYIVPQPQHGHEQKAEQERPGKRIVEVLRP